MPLTVGTAGHIDHGKTWLVRALTGKDTDRLPEEQARGHLDRPRLRAARAARRPPAVARRRAGARAVRAHDDRGRDRDRPLPARDRRAGRRSAADPRAPRRAAPARRRARRRRRDEVRRRRRRDARARDRRGARARARRRGRRRSPRRPAQGSTSCARRSRGCRSTSATPARPTRLYVDRVFTLPGIGHDRDRDALVGDDRRRATCCASSRRGRDRARAQRAGARRGRSSAPTRASASRSTCRRVERRELARGDVLVEPGHYPVSYRLDVRLEELDRDAGGRDRARRHEGGAARVSRATATTRSSGSHEPVVAARGDRVVLRTETTVGGGVVLDPAPPRGLDPERLEVLERGDAGGDRRRARARAGDRAATCRRADCSRPPSSRSGSRRCAPPASTTSRRRGSTSCARACTRGSPRAPRRARSIRACPLAELLPGRAVGAARAEPARASSGAARRRTCPGATARARRARGGCGRARGAARRRRRS